MLLVRIGHWFDGAEHSNTCSPGAGAVKACRGKREGIVGFCGAYNHCLAAGQYIPKSLYSRKLEEVQSLEQAEGCQTFMHRLEQRHPI